MTTRLALVAALLLAACGEWQATNPYDPRSKLELRIVGPDTARNYGDTLVYRLEITPAWRPEWPPLMVEWTATGPSGVYAPTAWLRKAGDDRAVVTLRRSDDLVAIALRATVGTYSAYVATPIRVTPVGIHAYACDDDPRRPRPMVFGSIFSRSVCYRLYDRDDETVAWPPSGIGLRVSARDAAVVAAAEAAGSHSVVTPRANGSTWLDLTVTAADGRAWRDSLAVVVKLP